MSRYTAAHASPNGPGDDRPTALQIVKDAEMEDKLVGKVAVVTGSSSGFGVETVKALAETGLKFFLPVRNEDKAKAALGDAYNPDRIEFIYMDQTSLESVREAAKQILAKTDKISLLVNNAGIMAVPDLQLTKDGFELQMATNHLSHFLLFLLLKPALLAGSTPEFNSRVVNVSSASHRNCSINEAGNYNFEKGDYNPFLAYGQSKTANIYMANELERRYGARGLHATSVHPGLGVTGLGRYLSEEQIQGLLANEGFKKQWKSVEQGASTTVWAAVGREWEGKGGKFLAECSEAPIEDKAKANDMVDPAGAYAAEHVYDPEREARLWKDSLAMVKFPDEE